MNDRRILLRLRQMLPQLPEQERKVGDYVLAHPHEAVGFSITRLAEASGASTTTVSRFCQRMGTKGYRQFRIALAKEWDAPHNLIYVEVQPDDSAKVVAIGEGRIHLLLIKFYIAGNDDPFLRQTEFAKPLGIPVGLRTNQVDMRQNLS